MTSAKVRAVYSLDVDIDSYVPVSSDLFSLQIRAIVGPADSEGEESFDITVCSPNFLAQKCEAEGFVVGRHYLFMSHFDASSLRQIIAKLVESISGSNWREIAEKVSRLGYWEFEDYQG